MLYVISCFEEIKIDDDDDDDNDDDLDFIIWKVSNHIKMAAYKKFAKFEKIRSVHHDICRVPSHIK